MEFRGSVEQSKLYSSAMVQKRIRFPESQQCASDSLVQVTCANRKWRREMWGMFIYSQATICFWGVEVLRSAVSMGVIDTELLHKICCR